MIHRLSPSVIGQLGSISDVETVIVELVANAIDAKASEIVVKLDWASLSVMVTDNGGGISRDDMDNLGQYCTSKMSQLLQLRELSTYGFRGEALYCINDVSRKLVIMSQTEEANWSENLGKSAPFDFDNELVNPRNMNTFHIDEFHNSGTVVLAYGLFDAFSVRRNHIHAVGLHKFLTSLKRKLVCIDLPKLKVLVDGVVKIDYQGGNAINALLGTKLKFQKFKATVPKFAILGIVSKSFKKGYQFLFLNKRLLHIDLKLANYPVFLINITASLPTNELFQDPRKEIWNTKYENDIQEVLAHVFGKIFNENIIRTSPKKARPTKPTRHPPPPKFSIPAITRDELDQVEVINQIDNKFILLKSSFRVYIIDQHAMDERIRVESLFQSYIETQDLMDCPYPISVTLDQLSELQYYQEYVKKFVQIDNGVVTKLSQLISGEADVLTKLMQYIQDIKDHKKFKIEGDWFSNVKNLPDFVIDILNSRACRLAIKFGDKLGYDQMAQLVGELKECRLPFQCAHGRPSIIPVHVL